MDKVLTSRLEKLLEREPPELVAAYLYGSFARGEEHADLLHPGILAPSEDSRRQ